MVTDYQKAFIASYGDSAAYASSKTGIPATFILGQWALETGWGQNFAGAYNLGNIQGGAARPYSYTSLQHGVDAYINTVNLPRYGAARLAESGEQFGQYMQLGGYAADPAYGSKLRDTIASVASLTGESGNTIGDSVGGVLPGGLGGFMNDPLTWLKNRGLSTLFFVGGIAGIAFLAWKYKPDGDSNGE